jgi:WD40 repeat protein
MPRRERPIETEDVPARFAAGLRDLRAKAGNPPYRELGRRAHYAAGTLSDAAAGRKLPTLAVTLAYVQALGGDSAEWERRWRDAAAAIPAPEPTADTATDSPYVGLAAFRTDDADRFFGRERLVDLLATRLEQHRLIGVFGASGAGKSSLLRAGLIPRLLADDPDRAVRIIAPGAHPLKQLDDLDTEDVIVVDQFEELFTLCDDAEERTQFIDKILATDALVVLGVRADFYGHCTAHAELVEALRDAQIAVGPMTVDELRQAITQPAIAVGCTVEGALLAELVVHTHGQVGVLPLLSHALRETWRRRRGNTLTLTAFQAAGGIEGALANTAESLYEELSADQQDLVRGLFLRLTALGKGTEDTKRRLPLADLGDDEKTVLDKLVDRRLLTVDGDTVEITHEALIRSWPRLRDWLADNREGMRTHAQLGEAAAGWIELGREKAALYRGTRLAVARDWASTSGNALSAKERDFLDASIAVADEEQRSTRRRTRRLRQLVAGLTVLLLVAAGATGLAVNAQNSANEQRDIALSQKVAGQVAQLRIANPALAAQLALAAYRLQPTVEARSALLSAFATPYATKLLGHDNNVWSVAYSPNGKLLASGGEDNKAQLWDVSGATPKVAAELHGYGSMVNVVAFSPDSKILATGSNDNTVRLFTVTDPRHPQEIATAVGHTGGVDGLTFSRDGKLMATGSEDHTVRLWDVSDPSHPTTMSVLSGHTERVNAVSISPDGHTLASISYDGTGRLWDISDPRQPRELPSPIKHDSDIRAVTFSGNGKLLASAGNDNAVRLWDTSDPGNVKPLAVLPHDNQATAVAFSPDNRILATGSADTTVQLWDLANPTKPVQLDALTGHTNFVISLAFSPDGKSLASGSWDRTVRIWDLGSLPLAGHSTTANAVAFAPDGRLYTGDNDGTIRSWDPAATGVPESKASFSGNDKPVRELVVSPTGTFLASAGNDNSTELWDLGGTKLADLPGHTNIGFQDTVFSAAISPDGKLLASTDNDRMALLRDISNPAAPRDLAEVSGPGKVVHDIAFSPDGTMIAVASGDNTVWLSDVSNPSAPTTLATIKGHTDEVYAVAFSPDGKTLATGSGDNTARLWDVSNRQHPTPVATLTGHSHIVYSVAFSPDGRLLATGSNDGTARLWDMADPHNPTPYAVITGHEAGVRGVALSADGHTLATASNDGTARLWNTDPEQVAQRICGRVYPEITPAEWEQYLPNVGYQPPCRR